MFIGDFPEDFTTVTCMFTTHDSTGAPVAPSSALEAADIRIYKNGSGTQKTSDNGITMTSPFDSVTGLHCVVIDTSNDTGDGGFWVANAQYTVVLVPDETVDSVAVAKVVGIFGLELSEVLRPTTAGRQLDVSAGGEAGLDWANIGSPTTTQTLSGTTVGVSTVTGSVTGDVGGDVVGDVMGNVNGNVLGSVAVIAADGITGTSFHADALTDISGAVWYADEATFASVADSMGALVDEIRDDAVAIQTKTDFLPSATAGAAGGVFIAGTNAATVITGSLTTAFTGNLTGTINGLTATALANFFNTDSTATAGSAIAGSVVKEIVDNATGASTADIADAVWAEALPGSYSAGQAGHTVDLITGLIANVPNLVWEEDLASHSGTAGSVAEALAGATAPSAATVADAVWDEALAGHATGGSAGAALSAAGTAGDPWSTLIPGAYGAGTAGKILGDNVNATISSRASQTSVDTIDDILDTEFPALVTAVGVIDDFLDLEIAAIKTKTDQLTFTTANRIDSQVFGMEADTVTASAMAANSVDASALAADAVTEIQSGLATAASITTLSAYVDTEVASILAAVDTEVAAIKTKTDFLPSATAGASGGVFIAGTNAATTVTTSFTTTFTGNLTGSVASVTGAVGSVTGAVGSVTGAVGSVTGAVGSVTGAVGSVTGAVGSIASGGITTASFAAGAINAAAIATDAIGSDELAASAITEIQSGLATSANQTTIINKTNLIPGTQDGKTFAETTLLMASVLLGKASGMATATGVFRALDDSQDRVTATTDANGNRTAVVYDVTSP